MAIDRRTILVGGSALLASAPLALPSLGYAAPGAPNVGFVSAARAVDGTYQIVFLANDGGVVRAIPLSGRGHDIALAPDGSTAVAFSRRPGTFAVAMDVSGRRQPQIFTAPADRHFFGHGVFSTDGRLLYATENDYEEARGVLGIYDVAAGYRRIGELPTHGVGPHDVLMMPDGVTLCVANGGIETHPDAGRAKLNLDTMAPSIVFINAANGDLKAQHVLGQDCHQLSLRHMCCDASGSVWFGGQWEGGADATPWLVGSVGIDRRIAMPEPRSVSGQDLKGYIGSMASSGDGRIVAASAPRAGRIIYFDAANAKVVGEKQLADACGIATAGDGGIACTSGEGVFELSSLPGDAGDLRPRQKIEGLSFDNHLRRIA